MNKKYLLTGLLATLFVGGCNWTGRAIDLVSDQVDPYELQRKYELFKDESAQLDKKRADLGIYEHRTKLAHCDTVQDPELLSPAQVLLLRPAMG